jgi:DNA polymerase-3 subunit delta'
MSQSTPEADRSEGAPHPRETLQLFGHQAAEAEFLSAFSTGRLHHGWMITGPRGLGKASLAWRMARFLLAAPDSAEAGLFGAPPAPHSLEIDRDDPVARRIQALSEPRLFLLRRPFDEKAARLRQEITVEEVRRMKSFFTLSAADGGRRVAIIDSVDEEEPPEGVTLILISHQPFRLLPTIRSRCRELRLSPLGPGDLAAALEQAGGAVAPDAAQALAELAAGSVGEAFRLTNNDGLESYSQLIRLFDTLPRLDRARALQLAEQGAGKGAEPRFELILTQIDLFLARTARAGVTRIAPPEAARGETELIARLAPSVGAGRIWAELAQTLGLRARRGKAVNLDPAALLMDIFLKLDETAAAVALPKGR